MQREMTKKISTCAFGALVAVALVPTGVARADQTDQDFTNFLQSHGVNLGTTAQTVNMARVMCKDLDAGYTEKDEVDQLTGLIRFSQVPVGFAGALMKYFHSDSATDQENLLVWLDSAALLDKLHAVHVVHGIISDEQIGSWICAGKRV